MTSLTGDGVGECGVVEAAGGCAHYAVERVHQDLDGVGSDFVAGAFRGFALWKQLIEDSRQDCAGASKVSTALGHQQILARVGMCDVAERIDVEGTDHARV